MDPEQSPLTEDEITKLKTLFAPLTDGQKSSFQGIVTRMDPSKGGKPRIYLYTEEPHELLLASENRSYNDLDFPISLSSKSFSHKSIRYIGRLHCHKYDAIYKCEINPGFSRSIIDVDPMHDQGIKIKYKRASERTLRVRQMTVSWDPKVNDDEAPLLQADFQEFHEKFPNITTIASEKNFYLVNKETLQPCFALAKTDDNEFFFYVAGPLSIFEGFCIASSTFHRVRGE